MVGHFFSLARDTTSRGAGKSPPPVPAGTALSASFDRTYIRSCTPRPLWKRPRSTAGSGKAASSRWDQYERCSTCHRPGCSKSPFCFPCYRSIPSPGRQSRTVWGISHSGSWRRAASYKSRPQPEEPLHAPRQMRGIKGRRPPGHTRIAQSGKRTLFCCTSYSLNGLCSAYAVSRLLKNTHLICGSRGRGF